MASKRQLQVGELIKRHTSIVLFENGLYIYGSKALVTVTNVRMSSDLGLAKIYLSIYNVDDKNEVLESIERNKHKLRTALASRIKNHVRRIPYIDFYEDEMLDEMYNLNQVFDRINKQDKEIRGEEE